VQRSRPEGYESEVKITYRVKDADLPIEVQGRIDGLYAGREPVILEEIKTTTLSLELVSEQHHPLHWAQAQCYAWGIWNSSLARRSTVHAKVSFCRVLLKPQTAGLPFFNGLAV
jgi:hypothetical protein